jgi:hypothetical protein
MANEANISAREAKYGERMIELKVRFWTDEISPEPGTVQPKHAWTSGVVRVRGNKSHGIVASEARPKPFNSLLDLGSAIEQTLKERGIVLHVSRGMKKYISG